jgi:hypothetical protein
MPKQAESIFFRFFSRHTKQSLFNPETQFDQKPTDKVAIAQVLNSAFLILLSGKKHKRYIEALKFLKKMAHSQEWGVIAEFYLNGRTYIEKEINQVCTENTKFLNQLDNLAKWLAENENATDHNKKTERIWSLFFPEGVNINSNRTKCIEELRKKRILKITETNPEPIEDPVNEILFTSNVLLGIPPKSKKIEDLHLSSDLKEQIYKVLKEDQLFWYDHPIPIGIEPEKNEVLYGMKGLDDAIKFERDHGKVNPENKLTCLLSASVTHKGLHKIAGEYLKEEFSKSGGLKNINLYVLTEADTNQLNKEILAPAARHFLNQHNAEEILSVFGADGEYGRHYSFLKAISAFWNVFIDPNTRATFKIDLDQVFPQKELLEQGGGSALEHFKTPLWGAQGIDTNENIYNLDMIAGALVNQKDVSKGLFTPDVPFPERTLMPDEHIFFSLLPQALSTEAEMMTRYDRSDIDGKTNCIQRIHVTGGTNGILLKGLFEHRPFTPSFFGRAEDQAFIMSDFPNDGNKLAYLHKAGLFMRHDKKAFAGEAIKAAFIGKLVGDYIRILLFSKYAQILGPELEEIKDRIDPFTGCFVSAIPTTIVYLRFALKAADFFSKHKDDQGLRFITEGIPRLEKALDFVNGEDSRLEQTYLKERAGWNLYYDTLLAIKEALGKKDNFAEDLHEKAKHLIKKCHIN